MSKTCSRCKVIYLEAVENFCKRRASKDGLNASCKACDKVKRATKDYDPVKTREYNQNYYKQNASKIKEATSAYYYDNHEACKAYRRQYSKLPISKTRQKDYRRHNRKKLNVLSAKYKAYRRTSKVVWADQAKIKEIYVEAARLTLVTGIEHQVDHIIPLRHPLVCGLHHEDNLQILTATENRSKGNKWLPI